MGLTKFLALFRKKSVTQKSNEESGPEKKQSYYNEFYLRKIITRTKLTTPEKLDLANPTHTIDLAIQYEIISKNVLESQELVTRLKWDEVLAARDIFEERILRYQMQKQTLSGNDLINAQKRFYAELGTFFGLLELRKAYGEYLRKLG